jgi:HSP20 family protein
MNDNIASPNGAESVSIAPTFVPPTDIIETKDALVMLLDMPSAEPETLNVVLDGRELTVTAQSRSAPPQGYTVVASEYETGNYVRSFTLLEEVDDVHSEAVFKDGVLHLTLPKGKSEPAKKISVKSA